MHLLFISSLLPESEPRSGFDIATRAIAAEYRRQGVRLSFAGFRRPNSRMPQPGEVVLGTLDPENALASRRRKLEWLARAVTTGLPVSAAKLATMSGATLTEHLASAGPVDGYVLNSIQMPAAYPFLPEARPSVFVAHNVEHLSAAENAENAGSCLYRRLYRREAALLKAAELDVCRKARIVHTLSADDLTGLGLAGHPSAFALPLTVGHPQGPDDGRRSHDVGLIGTWSWAPNRAGLDWFLREVVPLLPASLSIAIAGAFDGPAPRAPANVRFLGRVRDAQGFVRSLRVVALAARGGTGVQLKTLEALEEGMPAVATRSAMRAVGAVPANVAVADEAPGFAEALVEMVAGVREGRISRANGLTFALAQRRGLSVAIEDTLARFDALLSGRRSGAHARPGPAVHSPFLEPATAAV